jgi:hypothetical protein
VKLYASYRREQTQKNAVRTTLGFLRERVFDLKNMPWFDEKFASPDLNWREMHRNAVASNNRAPEIIQKIAAE